MSFSILIASTQIPETGTADELTSFAIIFGPVRIDWVVTFVTRLELELMTILLAEEF